MLKVQGIQRKCGRYWRDGIGRRLGSPYVSFNQFNTIKMIDDDGDMEKHLQKIEWLKLQIEEQGEQISPSSYISMLLGCAPSRYDVPISILEAQDDVTSDIIIN